MALNLYDVSVVPFLQTLGGVNGFLDRGLSHCQDNNLDLADIVDARVAADMLPFWFQIASVAHHSKGAIESVKAGASGPPTARPPLTYADLQNMVTDAIAYLKAQDPAEINALEGRDVVFALGERKMPFTAQGYLISFSLPNLHFHASTAYGILRAKGVPLGKRDYLGALQLKL